MPPKKPPRSKTLRKTHYTIPAAAKKLGISQAAVHKAIKTGRLDAKKGEVIQIHVTRGWQIPAKALEDYRVSNSHQQRGKKK